MSNTYAAQINSAHRLILAKGQAMVLYRISIGVYNPLAPEGNVPSIAGETPAAGVVLPASNGTIEAFDNRILADPAQRLAFRFVILAGKGLSFNPKAGDVLKTNEGHYRVLGSTPLDPTGQGPIIFNVGCTLDLPFELPIVVAFIPNLNFFDVRNSQFLTLV